MSESLFIDKSLHEFRRTLLLMENSIQEIATLYPQEKEFLQKFYLFLRSISNVLIEGSFDDKLHNILSFDQNNEYSSYLDQYSKKFPHLVDSSFHINEINSIIDEATKNVQTSSKLLQKQKRYREQINLLGTKTPQNGVDIENIVRHILSIYEPAAILSNEKLNRLQEISILFNANLKISRNNLLKLKETIVKYQGKIYSKIEDKKRLPHEIVDTKDVDAKISELTNEIEELKKKIIEKEKELNEVENKKKKISDENTSITESISLIDKEFNDYSHLLNAMIPNFNEMLKN